MPAAYDDVDDVEAGEKVTFRLSGDNAGHVLLIKGDRNSNVDTNELTGPYGVSVRRLVEQSKKKTSFNSGNAFHVNILDAEEWKELDEDEKLAKLCEIIEQSGK